MNSSSVVRDQEHVERFEEIRDFLDLWGLSPLPRCIQCILVNLVISQLTVFWRWSNAAGSAARNPLSPRCHLLHLNPKSGNGTRRKTIMQVTACKLERNSDRWQMPGIPLASITAQTAPLPRCFVRSPLQIALGKLNPALQKNYAKLVLDLKNFLESASMYIYIYISKQNPIHWNLLFTPPKDCILLELSGQIVTIFLGNCSGVC